ncbi:MAG TPA: OB-fold domain-containing protein, partial [Candidatus Dormibacteraeota bacterium]
MSRAQPKAGSGRALIAHLSGVVRRAGPDFLVLDVGGVGYLVSVSATTRQKIPAPGG